MVAWFSKPKYTTLKKPPKARRVPEGLWTKCPSCVEAVPTKDWEAGHKVCPKCGYHDYLPARARLDQLLDEHSFTELDEDLVGGDPLRFRDSKTYGERLAAAQEKTGLNEAVVAGHGKIRGRPVLIAAMDVGFMGGSMGAAAGEKIARTLERAIHLKLPVILVCGSGGARMQEGVISLMQMAKTSAVAGRLAQAGLPLVTILTHPSTGGVMASFASLGDVIMAEPNALVGFAGPRVIEATIKQILPPGFQRSEFVAEHGFVDIVCPRREMRSTLSNLLSFFTHAQRQAARAEALQAEEAMADAGMPDEPPVESPAEPLAERETEPRGSL
jgi:acetyl-CoA carboxylase carboxyl transferase subunit beta